MISTSNTLHRGAVVCHSSLDASSFKTPASFTYLFLIFDFRHHEKQKGDSYISKPIDIEALQ